MTVFATPDWSGLDFGRSVFLGFCMMLAVAVAVVVTFVVIAAKAKRKGNPRRQLDGPDV